MIDEQPWVGLLIGIALAVPFLVQVTLFTRNRLRHRRWRPATATVTTVRKVRGDGDGATTYRVGYRFADHAGSERTGSGEIDRRLTGGDDLDVLYDPADTGSSQPRRPVHVGHWVAGGLGLLLFVAAAALVVQSVHLIATGEMLFG